MLLRSIILNFLILSYLLVSTNANTLNDFGHYTNENGLSNNTITCITQDQFGFIWIGTTDGLNLFDGHTFKTYRHIQNDSASLPDNLVTCLFVDSKNNIWIGTKGSGSCVYNRNTNSFKLKLKDHNTDDNELKQKYLNNGLSNDFVQGIQEDNAGNIWIACIYGLTRFEQKNGVTESYFAIVNKDTILNLINSAGKIFPTAFKSMIDTFSTKENFILKSDLFNACSKKYGFGEAVNIIEYITKYGCRGMQNGLLDDRIRSISKTPDGMILIGYEYEAFSILDPNKITFKHFPYIKGSNGPSSKFVYSIGALNDNVYIGYVNDGFEVYNRKSNTFRLIEGIDNTKIRKLIPIDNKNIWITTETSSYNYNVEKGLRKNDELLKKNIANNNLFTTAFFDNQNSQWYGTNSSGIFQIIASKGFRVIDISNSLTKTNVNAICEDKKGNIWVGYNPSGLSQYTPQFQLLKHFEPGNINTNFIGAPTYGLFQNNEGEMWALTFNAGFQIYNPQTNKFKITQADIFKQNTMRSNSIKAIVQDKNGIYWFAMTYAGGLCRFDKKTNEYKTYVADYNKWQNNLASNWLNTIQIDNSGEIWIGSEKGISIFNPNDESFKSYNVTNSPLPHNEVNVLYKDKYNNIWIGTKGGLSVFESSKRSFLTVTNENNFIGGEIKSILQDKNMRIWVSTNFGIFVFNAYNGRNIDTLKIKSPKHFDIQDGISSNQFNDRAGIITSNGTIMFGSQNGITVFDPDSIVINNCEPSIYFTDLKIFNNSIQINKSYENKIILSKPIYYTDTIILDYKQYVLTFYFAALNYLQPEKNLYKYKLFGFNEDWQLLGNRNDLTYTNLNPGTYKLTVKACNNDGIWNNTGKSITIIINPPYWQTWWFRLLLISFILAIVVVGYYIRVQQIRRHNEQLKQLVRKKTSELQERADEIEEKNQLLNNQFIALNTTNKLLTEANKELIDRQTEIEEKQEEINLQKEELMAQRDMLEQTNTFLLEKQNEVISQNEELDKHRNALEKLVTERTNELEKALSKAEESNRLKSSFLANMSHEIRTPLNAIVGFANLLSEPEITEDEKNSFSGIIERNSKHLISLVNDIIDISKIESGIIKVEKNKTNLNFVFHDIDMIYSEELRKLFETNTGITFKTNIEANVKNIELHTDVFRLKQAIINLINNAIKFTKNGTVEFGCYLKTENTLLFYVKDSGIGIKEEHFSLIFERFRKVEDNKELFRGAGLGLSIVKQLIELLGGEIWVESEYGKGSVFYFTHPL